MTSPLNLTLMPEQMSRAVAKALQIRKPVLIVGAPGVGKTELLMQAAKSVDYDLLLSYPAIEDPTDPKGLPWFDPKSGKGDFVPLGVLKSAVEAKKPTLWVLEDLGQAADAVQAAYMSVLSTRTVGSHKLPDYVTVLATTNRKEHRAGVRGLLEPVKSRFSTIIELVPSLEDWCEWAISNAVDPRIISFLRSNPDYLLKPAPTLEIVNSPCPRTWANLSAWLKGGVDKDLRAAVYAGAVGAEAAELFMAFEDVVNELPPPEAVLMAPDSVAIPSNPSTLFALLTAVAYFTEDATFPNVVRFAHRMNEEGYGEMAGMLIKDTVRRHEHLLSSAAFLDVSTGPLADLIQ